MARPRQAPLPTTASTVVACPLGTIEIHINGEVLVAIDWTDVAPSARSNDPLLAEAARQIEAYFADGGYVFDLPLAPHGEPFEQAVWREMLAIPAGQTRSYGDLAAATGRPARAVGGACGRNPIPIVIPCHRVIGADGRMTGYSGAGGLETKRWLLRHEGALLI